MSEHIVTVDESNAQQVLIEESKLRPVLVGFWSDRSEPCKALMPLLEQLANEYQGKFLLAVVNGDEQQMIAQQLGVRSLPTVMLFKDGQPVDGFVGAQSETQVRALLNKYLPSPWDELVVQARELLAADDATAALPLVREAHEGSGHQADISLAYAQVLIALVRLDDAERILDEIRLTHRDALWEQLKAQLDLQREAASSPEIEAIELLLSEDSDNLDLRHQLAVQYASQGMQQQALENLYLILRQNREHGEGSTRKTLLDIIATLGKGDPLAVEYQRKLFGLMY